MSALTDWILSALVHASSAAIAFWIAGAILYDVCGDNVWGRLAALGWLGAVVTSFAVWEPLWQPFLALLLFTALFFGWWIGQKPSQNRDWDPTVAVLARFVREGDLLTIENVRNFDYPAAGESTARYDTRSVHLSNLYAADIIFFNWGSEWMSHPVLVFDFGADGRICISIEVRYRKGQAYSLVPSLYRQQELIFLVADERDVILRRTKFDGNQDARLYHFTIEVSELREVFVEYVEAINSLYVTPRWYNGLCANCTTSFYRLPGRRCPCDWRVLANGRLDRALYEAGRLDRTLPFAELRRLAYLNDIANAAPEAGFGDHIRRELERRRHER